jgi:hypothetical protein
MAVFLAVLFFAHFFADFLGAGVFTAVALGKARFFLAGAANSGAGTAAASVPSGM